ELKRSVRLTSPPLAPPYEGGESGWPLLSEWSAACGSLYARWTRQHTIPTAIPTRTNRPAHLPPLRKGRNLVGRFGGNGVLCVGHYTLVGPANASSPPQSRFREIVRHISPLRKGGRGGLVRRAFTFHFYA